MIRKEKNIFHATTSQDTSNPKFKIAVNINPPYSEDFAITFVRSWAKKNSSALRQSILLRMYFNTPKAWPVNGSVFMQNHNP